MARPRRGGQKPQSRFLEKTWNEEIVDQLRRRNLSSAGPHAASAPT